MPAPTENNSIHKRLGLDSRGCKENPWTRGHPLCLFFFFTFSIVMERLTQYFNGYNFWWIIHCSFAKILTLSMIYLRGGRSIHTPHRRGLVHDISTSTKLS